MIYCIQSEVPMETIYPGLPSFLWIAQVQCDGRISPKTFASGLEPKNCWLRREQSNRHPQPESKKPKPLLVTALCVGWLPG